MEEEQQIRQTAEFKELVARMYAPLKPGVAHVRSPDFYEEFEDEYPEDVEPLEQFETAVLDRARRDAAECFNMMEQEMLEIIEYDALRFIEDPSSFDAEQRFTWNATNLYELEINIGAFCDSTMRSWSEDHFPVYLASLDIPEREAVGKYVESSVEFALAVVPYHIKYSEEELYYDSADTDKADQ